MTEYSDRPGYSFNPGPPPEASRFLKNKGLKTAFSWQDVEPEEHAVAFTVAKAMQIDVLTAIREEVQKALDEGLPLAAFQKNLKPRLQALGWWGWKEMVDPETGDTVEARLGSPRRLRTIYNANLRSARAAGQWERIERTKKLLPFLEYRLGPSEHHRPHHAIKAGLVLPVDDPFWDAWMPPNGWGCKCWVRQLTRREAEAKGVDTAPKLLPRKVLNKRTGEMKEVPPGIDPGWERNPGKLRLQAVTRLLVEKMDQLPNPAAEVAARDMLSSWAFARMIDAGKTAAKVGRPAPKAFVAAAVLPADVMEASGATVRGVILSSDTATKQAKSHSDLSAEDYQRLLGLLTDQDLHGLVYGVSQLVENQTKERIATGKHAPDGAPWPAWSADYAATRHQGQSLLVGLGNPGLLESIQNYATGLEAVVGTPLVYGAIHQFGGAGAGKPGLPARPYLGLSKDDREAIEALVVDSLGEMLK